MPTLNAFSATPPARLERGTAVLPRSVVVPRPFTGRAVDESDRWQNPSHPLRVSDAMPTLSIDIRLQCLATIIVM